MNRLFKLATSITILGLSCSVLAHDPSLHKQEGAPPNCTAFKNMDQSKMDSNDPIMQAMIKQCSQYHHDTITDNNHHKSDTKAAPENKKTE